MKPTGIVPHLISLPVIKVARVFVGEKSPLKDFVSAPNPEPVLTNESVPVSAISEAPTSFPLGYEVSVLKELLKDVPAIDLKRGDKRRKVFDVWSGVNGEMFNLSGHVNESKGKGITVTVYHHSPNPISFEGIPLVLEPKIKPGQNRFNRSGNPVEVALQASRLKGEYRASFSKLNPSINSYTLKVGE